MEDLYQVLGVPRDADPAAIKAAFRRQAKDAHPDLGGDPELFRRLKLAHDVLADAETRTHYDETGELPEDEAFRAAEDGRFRKLIGDLLVTMIAQGSSPAFSDVLLDLDQSLGRQIEAADHKLVSMGHLLARLGEVRARLHAVEDENFLSVLLDERYKEMERNILLTRALKRRLANLRQRLTLYRYDVETDLLI